MAFLETILAVAGDLPYLRWHQQRLERTLGRHGIAAKYRLSEIVLPPSEGRWRCRVLYDAEEISVEYHPYVPRIVTSLRMVGDENIVYRDKTTERRALDALFAARDGADDVLIVQNGLITDTTIANVACLIGGRWLTPASPLLEGTARARLLEEGRLELSDITPADALGADKIAVMNALSGFVEVSGGILQR